MNKPVWSFAWIGLTICVALDLFSGGRAEAAAPVDLPAAVEQQAAARAVIAKEFVGRAGLVKGWYVTALDALQQDATTRGDLDRVIEVKKERERADRPLTPEELTALAEPIRGLRLKYDQALATLANQQKMREAASIREYVGTLESLEKRLTQRSDVDSALKVRQEASEAKGQATALEISAKASVANAPTEVPGATAPLAQQPFLPPRTTPPLLVPAPAKPATPATPARSGGPTGSSHPALVGSWHFKWIETGYEWDYTFAADGTFHDTKGSATGTWKVAGDRITMESPGIPSKTIYLPIKPSGTKVIDQRKNRTIQAVKLKE